MRSPSRLLSTIAIVALAACSSSSDNGSGGITDSASNSNSSGPATSRGGSQTSATSGGGGNPGGGGNGSASNSPGSSAGSSNPGGGSGTGSNPSASGSGSASGSRSASGSTRSTSSTTSVATSSVPVPGGDGGMCGGTVPSGGTQHCSANASGTAGSLSWTLWSNGAGGCLTTYGTSPAYSASWSNTGDFLARAGLDFNQTAVSSLGTVTAEFDETKTGTGGGFSYIGIYGWSVSPCIEWYIVEDSYNKMPVNPGSTTKMGTATVDGGSYILYTRPTSGTGGSRCPGINSWTQFYSVRQTARTCGQITITDHFAAWANAGMNLGSLLEAKILVETGGGSGSIDFTTASVTSM